MLSPQLNAHRISATVAATPEPMAKQLDNMNGLYAISNPNTGMEKAFSTSFDSYPDVEYFEVYSPPISTRCSKFDWIW